VIRQYNVNLKQFAHVKVSSRSTWQSKNQTWLTDTSTQMGLLTAQHNYNHTMVTICFQVYTLSKLGTGIKQDNLIYSDSMVQPQMSNVQDGFRNVGTFEFWPGQTELNQGLDMLANFF